MKTIKFDNHMHCNWSGDSDADPLSMISSAKEKGLSGLTFTDHIDLDYYPEPHFFDLDIPAYCAFMKDLAQKESTEDFTVLRGIEMGIQPHLAEDYHRILTENSFDFVLGSTHLVDGIDPYYGQYFAEMGHFDGLKRYFEYIYENITAFSEFDSLAHLDYLVRYVPADFGEYHYEDHMELIEQILRFLVVKDKALEINTGSFRNGMREPNPCIGIIRRYRELGGQLITVGADAHCPEHVALEFHRIPGILKDCGFDSYYVYQNRIPQPYEL